MHLINVPRFKDKNITLIGEVVEGYLGRPMLYRVRTSEHCYLCAISTESHELIAEEIAKAIEQARDIGYRQAMEDLRNFIGIKG